MAATLVARLTTSDAGTTAPSIERVARIKDAISASDYENALKLSVALDRMIERHGNA